LTTPGEDQLQTLAGWSAQEARSAWLELCWHRAALCWCGHCRRLVTAGCHSSDWRRQFWSEDESPEFLRHVRDLGLLRDVECAGMVVNGRRGEAAPPPAATPAAAALPCGLKEMPPPPDGSGDWEWLPDEGEAADAMGQAQAEADADEGR
jgi:hypothetical protein